jgi:hypothetical protein
VVSKNQREDTIHHDPTTKKPSFARHIFADPPQKRLQKQQKAAPRQAEKKFCKIPENTPPKPGVRSRQHEPLFLRWKPDNRNVPR